MAQRGRQKIGKTVAIRVPVELHQMITWVADAERRSAVRVVEELIHGPLTDKYRSLMDTIKKLKEIEDERAKIDNREPFPMPPFLE